MLNEPTNFYHSSGLFGFNAFLCFHVYVLMWCSFAVHLLVVTLQKKLSSCSHKVHLTENRTVGFIPRSGLGGGAHFIASAPGAENPSYATSLVLSRRHSCQSAVAPQVHTTSSTLEDSGYSYDSTSIRRPFDGRSTAHQSHVRRRNPLAAVTHLFI